mgnify:CR=1 FL=1
MNNEYFNNFTNQNYSALSNWLDKLDPYEFSLVGVLAAYLIAPSLDANEQNSIGNFFEEIGQILLTIAAQQITVTQSNQNNKESVGLYDKYNTSPDGINNNNNIRNNSNDFTELKKELEYIKFLLNKNNIN